MSIDYEVPVCPICGEECDTIYKKDGEVIGCYHCIDAVDAWEWAEQEEDNRLAMEIDRAFEDMRYGI